MPSLELSRMVSNQNTGRILLAGNVTGTFLDADAVAKPPFEVHSNVLDAIDAAARGSFSAIGIVMSGLSERLNSVAKAIRNVNPDAKIVLLAQVYEESAAKKLIGISSNGTSVADDYLICPVRTDWFYKYVSGGPATVETTGPFVDYSAQMRIKQLERLATEDDLTGLKNRRYIWEFSKQIIKHAAKENGRVTLLVFDIDYFKHYNDTYGHSAGDEILKQTAVLIKRCCRPHDVVGRIGGDEFAVVFWDGPAHKSATESERRSLQADHPKETIPIIMRFRKELEKTQISLLNPENKGALAVSGGLASFPRDGSTVKELFEQADKALLEAKRSGKNKVYLVGKHESDIADIA